MRMFMDYQSLNVISLRNRYPLHEYRVAIV